MTKKIAILGCGPAGLLAAHAAQINQCSFDIFSKRRPSHLFGSQYLHEPITGVTGTPERVRYSLVGTPEEYRRKVYGPEWDGTVSPEDLEEEHWAWDIRQAYTELWRRYSDEIHHLEFGNNMSLLDRAINFDNYDMILSTVPRKVWAQPGDAFRGTEVWAVGDAPELGQTAPFTVQEDFTIICDGTPDVGWYRLSKVFGYTTIEWPGNRRPPIPGIAKVTKPLSFHMAPGPSDQFIHLGRYGKWEKGVLTTDAFNEALKATA